MPRRLDAGAVVAAAGAVLLLVSLFLDWYGDDGEGFSAWTIFEVIDLLLAGIALLALSTFLSRSGVEPRLPEAPLLLLGALALVLTASQLIDEPPAVALVGARPSDRRLARARGVGAPAGRRVHVRRAGLVQRRAARAEAGLAAAPDRDGQAAATRRGCLTSPTSRSSGRATRTRGSGRWRRRSAGCSPTQGRSW